MATADSVEFIRKHLGLDITNAPFGSPLTNYPGAAKTWTGEISWQLPAKLDWYQTDASTAYEREHPHRRLRYGFSEGRSAAIEIFIDSFSAPFNDKETKAVRASIDSIRAEFRKLGGKGLAFEDVNLRLSYDGMCNSSENLGARIIIAPPEKK